jgi:hypothetical protein
MTAPAEPGQVGEWWRRWPDANVGVVTGWVSGVVVLDVDPRHGGDRGLERLEARWGTLPVTVESRTGGGGSHLWFQAPRGPVPSAVLAPGVELKAEGGVVVIPPSRHASGRVYAWRDGRGPDDLAPEILPAWLADLARGLEPERPDSAGDPPVRTSQECEMFADAWRRAGIDLLPGDRYYLCPFHDDHRPSLHVDSDGCRWYCFGCRRGGGIAALLDQLGEPRTARPRARLRGWVGGRRDVNLHGEAEVEVVGESLHQDELLALAGGERPYGGVELDAAVELLPDPGDLLAVDVVIDGRTVGRLRREDAATLRQLVDQAIERDGAAICHGEIRGGWDRGRGDVGLFGVVLQLPAAG